MKNINIKVIKANSDKHKEEIIPTPVIDNEEKKIVRKITQNVNSWIKEYYARRTAFKNPGFIH